MRTTHSLRAFAALSAFFALWSWLCVSATVQSASPEQASVDFTRPFPIVMVPTMAGDEHRQLADVVAELIGVARVQESTTNPVCCIWLEINHYTPNPGSPGYTIINQPGGSIITASNIAQLRAAVERFKQSARQNNGHVEVPVGLMTSYPVVGEN